MKLKLRYKCDTSPPLLIIWWNMDTHGKRNSTTWDAFDITSCNRCAPLESLFNCLAISQIASSTWQLQHAVHHTTLHRRHHKPNNYLERENWKASGWAQWIERRNNGFIERNAHNCVLPMLKYKTVNLKMTWTLLLRMKGVHNPRGPTNPPPAWRLITH